MNKVEKSWNTTAFDLEEDYVILQLILFTMRKCQTVTVTNGNVNYSGSCQLLDELGSESGRLWRATAKAGAAAPRVHLEQSKHTTAAGHTCAPAQHTPGQGLQPHLQHNVHRTFLTEHTHHTVCIPAPSHWGATEHSTGEAAAGTRAAVANVNAPNPT